jgi:hypothetical protein
MSRERHEQTCTTPDCAAAEHPARRGHKPAVGPPVFRVVLFACLMLPDTGCALPSPAKGVLGWAGAPSGVEQLRRRDRLHLTRESVR